MVPLNGSAKIFQLTASERRVIVLLAQGLQSKEMARAMCRSRPTIERYVQSLHRKFGSRSRAHLVALALSSGCVTLSPPARP